MRNKLLKSMVLCVGLLVASCTGSGGVATDDSAGDAALDQPAAAPDSAAPEAPTPVPPPPEPVWEQVDGGDECMCSDGSEWSFWVREADPTRVVLYLQGGGACWSRLTCNPDVELYKTVIDETDDPNGGGGILDIENPDNPFADWSWVVVPYCTGDLHLGDATQTYGDLTVEHNGLVNGRRAIAEMVERFPGATEVLVAGSSAGGVAAPLYAGLIADRFPQARLGSLADASGAYPNVSGEAITNSWGVADALPPWATGDAADLTIPGLFVAAAAEHPSIGFARFDHAEDSVQDGYVRFSGVTLDDAADLEDQIRRTEEFIEAEIEAEVASYVAPGDGHTVLDNSGFYEVTVDGVVVRDWVAGFAAGTDIDDVDGVGSAATAAAPAPAPTPETPEAPELPELPELPVQPAEVPWPTDAWPEGEVSSDVDAAELAALIADAFDSDESPYGRIEAAVVIDGGELVFQRYGRGYEVDETHVSWSVGKSVAHALLGVLVGAGELDITAPAAIPEWADDARAEITPDMLARMSSGLEWNEVTDVGRLVTAIGRTPAAGLQVERDLASPPDTVFNYSTGSTAVNGRIMGDIVGTGDAFENWADDVLFDPLGITVELELDIDGYWVAGYGSDMTARDFARFGLLYLRNGVWGGRQVLPAGWVDYGRTPGPTTDFYGSGFWLDLYGEGTFSAEGFLGQKVVMVPEHDLVVVVLSNNPVGDLSAAFASELVRVFTG